MKELVGSDQFELAIARRSALSSVYCDYSREVRACIAWKLTGAQDLEDLVQEVFLRAHQAFSFQDIEHPRAYLHQIANSVICDYFRKGRRRRALPGDLEQVDEAHTAHTGPTPEEVAIGEETCELLCSIVNRLPKKVRQAIELRKLEDLSYREVAETMGISVRTVEKHLARGLGDLRDGLDEPGTKALRPLKPPLPKSHAQPCTDDSHG